MKHATTRALHEHWDRIRGDRSAPARIDLDPADLRPILSDVFVIGMEGEEPTYNLAGSRMAANWAVEFKGLHALHGWTAADRELVAVAISEAAGQWAPVVIGATLRNARGEAVSAEILFAPLVDEAGRCVRLLGSQALFDTPRWLAHEPFVEASVFTMRMDRKVAGIDIGASRLPSFSQSAPTLARAPRQAFTPAIFTQPEVAPTFDGRRVAHLTVIEGGRPA